jgi:outer membrane protein assembly factor BamA
MRFLPLLLALVLFAAGISARASVAEPGADVLAEYYPKYNGVLVTKIEITGLRRSRETMVRWLLGAREGEPFDAQRWQTGIEHLYKTESLYAIHSLVGRHIIDGREELWIQVSLEDKWTLFPYVDFQGGGGALALSGGLYESNLFGTFTNFYVGATYLDKDYGYELGLSQKWFLETTYSVAFELSKRQIPVSFENAAGLTLQNFAWNRAHQVLSVGKQNGEQVYWEFGFEAFRDSLVNANPRTSTFVFADRGQYRVAPALKLWKVSHSDYLEAGHELTMQIADANPTTSSMEYHSATASWKQVFFLPDTKNLAYYISASHMSAAPLSYQFRLGGFDSVRGFAMNRVFGLDIARTNLEYRSTFLKWEIPFFDLGPMVLQDCVFTDLGASWNSAGIDLVSLRNTQRDTRWLYSAGLGLRAIFLHFADATARIDLAKALYPQEGFNVAFGIGQFF